MLLLTDEELQLHQDSTVCYKFTQKPAKDRNYCKVRDHCHFTDADKYRGTAHRFCNLGFNVPKKIQLNFHKGSNYGYHFLS